MTFEDIYAMIVRSATLGERLDTICVEKTVYDSLVDEVKRQRRYPRKDEWDEMNPKMTTLSIESPVGRVTIRPLTVSTAQEGVLDGPMRRLN